MFLEGVKSALTGGRRVQGRLVRREAGQEACARPRRVYAGWGFSQAFYWQTGCTRRMGSPSLEDFLVGFWEGFFLDRRDPNNLLTMLWTWQNGDVGETPGPFDGDQVAALQSIKAKMIVLPALKDLYFPPEDEEYAVAVHPERRVPRHPGRLGSLRGRRRTPSTSSSSTTSSKSSSRAEEDQPERPNRTSRPPRRLLAGKRRAPTRRGAKSGPSSKLLASRAMRQRSGPGFATGQTNSAWSLRPAEKGRGDRIVHSWSLIRQGCLRVRR